jgi:hypothetical protein
MAFLPPDFEVPELLETDRFRIRPLTTHDVVKDYDAGHRLHSVDQRQARWLLMTQDRTGGKDQFPSPRSSWAQMLGVRRATVTEAAGRLAQARLIHYSRGSLVILLVIPPAVTREVRNTLAGRPH